MKGSLRKIHDHLKNRTNFNDWSDPKCDKLNKTDSKYIPKVKSLDSESIPLRKDAIPSQTTNEIEDIKRKVKAGNPLLSLNEVRNFKLPFYESLLLNLHDDGFTGTYLFIKEIIDHDDYWHNMTKDDNLVKKRPQLKLSNYALQRLSAGLIAAEKARREGSKTDELISFLDLALDFTKLDEGLWHWLSEELYEQCIHITNMVESPTEYDREMEAILKFVYAEFQLDILHEPNQAKKLLEESMKLSEGKLYNARVLTSNIRDVLYLDSCILFHRILLMMADESRETNIENAINLYKHSLHWAQVVNNKVAEATALLHLVQIYITAQHLNEVPENLENYLRLCKEQNNIRGICEGYILLAKYHNLINEYDLEGEDLQALLKTAQENNILEIVALAHQKLAIFNLSHSNSKENAQYHAYEAYHCYIKLNRKPEIEASSCLIGVCQGEGILPHYMRLFSKSDKVCSESFGTLMKWHTLRIPFFSHIKLLQVESDQNNCLQKEMENLRNLELKDTDFQIDKIRVKSIRTSRKSLFSYHSRLSRMSY